MAIVNRDLDGSEQRKEVHAAFGPVTLTGGTYVIGYAPWQAEVKAIRINAVGLSSVPVFEIEGYKFTVGASTSINSAISTATSAGAFNLSGPVALTLGTAGSTQVQLDQGMALVLTVTGANSAAANVSATVVLQKLQDIASTFGVA